jgi:4-amino-4-deoxy-L-arabinose transferase-like glycosyltransferase
MSAAVSPVEVRSPNESSRLPWVLAGIMVIFLFLTNHGYGFHRDELATLDDARHLAWGFVAYPPITPFFGWISLHLFGTSLPGFRLFASIAAALVAVLTAAIARELGGNRTAQTLAASATLAFGLATGSLMQYVAFDYLWWVLTCYGFVRLVGSDDPRWWIAIGASIGLGMLTKYSMLFCVAGLSVAFAFARRWRDLRSPWLWTGVLISTLIFLPNFLWQVSHQFVSLEFLQHIHARDIRIGRTKDFLPDQLKITLFALPLVILGLWFFCLSKFGQNWRSLACLYLTPLILFVIGQGRGYYLAPTYPLLFAAGSAWLGLTISPCRAAWRALTWSIAFVAAALNVAAVIYFVLPVAPVGTSWWRTALKTNGDLAEEFGWPELASTVAAVRNSLPPETRKNVTILAANYGEAGAINLYGPDLGLPAAISGVNSFWARGYGDPPPKTLIVIGFSREFLQAHFQSCEIVGQITNQNDVANEETTDHRGIFICRDLKEPWPEFWKKVRHYG